MIDKSPTRAFHDADIVIAINHTGAISMLKNRYGDRKKLDMAGLLEIVISYQEEHIKHLILPLINKLKVLRPFS